MTSSLPPCGLYRTGRRLQLSDGEIPEGILVMFHNHSDRGIPMLQLPKENTHNVWSFHEEGPGIEDPSFLEALQPLRPQGFYFLKEDLQTPDGSYPAKTLVQLGYNRDGEPILFPAQRPKEENTLFFSERGYRFFGPEIFENLSPEEPLIFMEYQGKTKKKVQPPAPKKGGLYH